VQLPSPLLRQGRVSCSVMKRVKPHYSELDRYLPSVGCPAAAGVALIKLPACPRIQQRAGRRMDNHQTVRTGENHQSTNFPSVTGVQNLLFQTDPPRVADNVAKPTIDHAVMWRRIPYTRRGQTSTPWRRCPGVSGTRQGYDTWVPWTI